MIYFLDTIFAEARRASQLALLREGLGAARALNNWRAPIHELTEAQQDQLLRDNEQTPLLPPCDISP